MEKGTREQNIKHIINMEDRICQCNRCPSLTRCVRKPTLGKGDLEPKVLMVFESDNSFTRDTDKVVQLRDMIKKSLKTERLYHTFLVRCHPKACPVQENADCYLDTKLLNKEYACLLTNQICDGISIKPSNDSVMNCLPFLLEEIEILQPSCVVLFGQRVGEYVKKSSGIFEDLRDGNTYEYGKVTYLTTVEEKLFSSDDAEYISKLIGNLV